jgi:acetyl-CoA C-acetyltransferase
MKSLITNTALVASGVPDKVRWGMVPATFRELISMAAKAVFDSNPNISPKDVDGLVVCTVWPERTAFQSHVAPLAAEYCGVNPTTLCQRVEIQCASGIAGIRTAAMAVASGISEMVLVVGVEKMYTPKVAGKEHLFHGMSGSDREWEGCYGLQAPPLFGLAATAHVKKYGTTEEQMAMISVKNHRNASKNPYAMFPKTTTIEEVLNSRVIAAPLKLFDCSSITDGSAAVIVTSAERAKDLTDKPVYLMGTNQSIRGLNYCNMSADWSDWSLLREASGKAYEMAGITAKDIDLAETHDCFTISEIIEYEELGFCEKGEGGKFIEEGLSDYGGQVVVNSRGGLIGCGHPLGATGVGQAHEMYLQLRGEAGERQVPDAKIGLSQTLESMMGFHIIIYGREQA